MATEVPIEQREGKRARCPRCNAIGMVEPPRLRRADQYVAPTPESPHIRFVVTPVGGKLWWILDCPREGKQSIQEGTLLDIDGCD